MSPSAAPVAVALKCVDLRPDIDSLTGVVTSDLRWAGLSDADEAALETALRLAEQWGTAVVAVSAGPTAAEAVLRRALASGASSAVRVEIPADTSSAGVALALADAVAGVGASVVVCGAFSLDRGSGSVPAFLAHHLGAAQALGLVAIEMASVAATAPAEVVGDAAVRVDADSYALEVTRRLDGGRRELLLVEAPAVLSVEGSVARLRRAPLAAALRAESAEIAVVDPASAGSGVTDAMVGVTPTRRPYRPRARAFAPPQGSTLQRILELTDAATPRTPPRLVELEPVAAAAEILAQLREWGELDDGA